MNLIRSMGSTRNRCTFMTPDPTELEEWVQGVVPLCKWVKLRPEVAMIDGISALVGAEIGICENDAVPGKSLCKDHLRWPGWTGFAVSGVVRHKVDD